jgi:hypothetical protein
VPEESFGMPVWGGMKRLKKGLSHTSAQELLIPSSTFKYNQRLLSSSNNLNTSSKAASRPAHDATFMSASAKYRYG